MYYPYSLMFILTDEESFFWTICLGVGCVDGGRLLWPLLVLCLVQCPPALALLTWLWQGLLHPVLCIPRLCCLWRTCRAFKLSVWVMLVMPNVFSFLSCYPGLLYFLLTSGYCFHLSCSFANKVALTKADLQGREGSCSHYPFGLKDALCNPWYLLLGGLQAVTPLGQQQLWEGAELCSEKMAENPDQCMKNSNKCKTSGEWKHDSVSGGPKRFDSTPYCNYPPTY